MEKDECIHHSIAWSQRLREDEQGLSHEGTMGYENTGCYRCEGKNRECEKFISRGLLSTMKYGEFK